jgi:pyruvate dehydrogenase E2 component (dihydrolipoamide acetyltransferase)
MAEVILMPRLSDTMTEGVIAAWHKKVGDNVKKGDLLAEVETDKATMDLESYKDGTLLFTGTAKGGKIQVNDLLAIIGKPGEDISSLVKGGATQPAPVSASAAPAPAAAKQEQPSTTNNQPPASQGLDLSTMQEVILMPRLSDTMTDGVIAAWHKKVGDTVKKGDILADIETDKATMELESYKEGKLLYTGAEKGQKIAVNDLLAIIGDEGKVNVKQIVDASKNKGITAPAPAKEQAAEPAALKSGSGPAPTDSPSLNGDGRIKASPLAKKLASEKGIDLSQLHGSGDFGRIVKKDVAEFKPGAAAPVASSSRPGVVSATQLSGQVSFDDVPVSQMRKVIAKRLSEAKFTAPEFYLTIQVDMDQAVASRGKINETSPVKISFNDFVLKATALALKKHPAVNSSWMGDKIRVNHHVNIGVAVAVEDGLLVPVVRFADAKSLSQISTEVKEFAVKAKNKKLQPADWEGSTFTISNLGMFGMDEFTAIINPPDACILAISSIQQIPVVKNGAIVPGNVMKLTMTCDHRVVDGATGAAFLQTLKGLLEEPLRMLV